MSGQYLDLRHKRLLPHSVQLIINQLSLQSDTIYNEQLVTASQQHIPDVHIIDRTAGSRIILASAASPEGQNVRKGQSTES
jgi:hypothetical protein